MNFSTLDRLVTEANAATASKQQQAVDELKAELQPAYDEAKRQLPGLDQAVKEARAFLSKLDALAAKSAVPLPHTVVTVLRQVAWLCESAPRQVKDGIKAFEQLAWSQIVHKDGTSLDVNMRASVRASVHIMLSSWDGSTTALPSLCGQIDTALTDAQWPLGYTPAPLTAVAPEPVQPVRVEKEITR